MYDRNSLIEEIADAVDGATSGEMTLRWWTSDGRRFAELSKVADWDANTRPYRQTDAELIAEIQQVIAERYPDGAQDIRVKPLAHELGIGRDRCRRLLDQMSVRPIRKAGTS
jgi:hypothetical protein